MDYKDANELVQQALPLKVRRQIYNVFDVAFKAYREFMDKNKVFFDNDLSSNIKYKILGYAVDRQFLREAMDEKFALMADYKSVNQFNYKVLHIYDNDIIVNIARTKKDNILPAPSAYRVKNASNNKFFDRQMMMDISGGEVVCYVEPPYYSIITYGVQQDELSHLTLMVPDDKMKSYYNKIDIKNEIKVLEFNKDSEQEQEVKVASLKSDLVKKYIHSEG